MSQDASEPTSHELLARCDQLLDELLATRRTLTESLCQVEMTTETAHAYNATLFHLQSAREELKRTIRGLTPPHDAPPTKG